MSKVIAEVIIAVDNRKEVEDWENWLEKHQEEIELSENEGCGCCVDVYQITCEEKLVDTIPDEILSTVKPIDK